MANEKYRNHVNFPSCNALICRVLELLAEFDFFVGIVKNVTKLLNRGKTGQVDVVKSSKNVVGIEGFYYCADMQIYMYFSAFNAMQSILKKQAKLQSKKSKV